MLRDPGRSSMWSVGRPQAGAAQWMIVPALVVLAVVIAAFIFGTVVGAGSMGIRQVMFGPAQGFSERALAPGYHWSLPTYSKVHVFPATLRILNLHSESLKKDFTPSATRDLPRSDRDSDSRWSHGRYGFYRTQSVVSPRW
ncbi:MAG: hypothetical protein QY326_09790 [Bdellovibrionota bacterium]|nr:MAG: hypothetical protein QY326_09790 [Bdellovibrionota bacterium]